MDEQFKRHFAERLSSVLVTPVEGDAMLVRHMLSAADAVRLVDVIVQMINVVIDERSK